MLTFDKLKNQDTKMRQEKKVQTITMTPKLKAIKAALKEQGYKFTIFAELAIRDAIERGYPVECNESAPSNDTRTIRIDTELVDWLNIHTKPSGSKSAFIRQAIEEYARIKGI